MSQLFTKKQSLSLLEKALDATSLPYASAWASSSHHVLTRFAADTLTQNVARSHQSLSLEVAKGSKHGSTSTNKTSAASLKDLAHSAELAARFAPKDPEYVLPAKAQPLEEPSSYSPCFTWLDPEQRAETAAKIIAMGRKKGLRVSGVVSMARYSRSLKTSQGFEGYQRSSEALCSVSMEGKNGSGWAEQVSLFPEKLHPMEVAEEAMTVCLQAQRPREIAPGEYPVIFSTQAVASLLAYLVWQMNAREADEKRSCFTGKTGKRIGNASIHLRSQPLHTETPGISFNGEGVPARDSSWIEGGVLKNLPYSRYWAKKKKVRNFTFPSNLIMDSGHGSMDDLIAGTDRALLVTRLWYIRMVEPMSLTLTGLTRDGTFWVEKGQIKRPVRNLRFNDSPLRLLSLVDQMGSPCPVGAPIPAFLPPLLVKSFRFTSVATK